jgi:hypothetical protein
MSTTARQSSFTYRTVSQQEAISGAILSTIQAAVINNIRVDIAEQKLALTYSPDKPYDFVQQEAFLAGQLEILQYLLDQSDAVQKVVNDSTNAVPLNSNF